MRSFSYPHSAIESAADRLLATAGDCRIWTFSGGLGAGKTTLISALCRRLGVNDAVSSPTFALINEYAIPAGADRYATLLHMDWYRVGDTEEAIQAGLEDALLRADARVWVEWPEKAVELLAGLDVAEIVLEVVDEGERSVGLVRSQPREASGGDPDKSVGRESGGC